MSSSSYVPKCALFIFAHPDDIEYSVAGTAAKWCKNGSKVIYLILTDGASGYDKLNIANNRDELRLLRKKEQIEAGNVIGVSECIFFVTAQA